MKYAKTLEEFFENVPVNWNENVLLLRSILKSTEMKETLKWGIPVYTIGGKNIVGIAAFKDYVGMWFYQGVFLEDKANKLFNAQEGKTKALRQWRFLSKSEIDERMILEYVQEAIQNQKDGREVKVERKKKLIIPDLLKSALEQDEKLNKCFEKFTMGKQREFAEYIDEAKREVTKINRLEKIKPMIFENIGLNDKYRKI